jgi:hypothetical protein
MRPVSTPLSRLRWLFSGAITGLLLFSTQAAHAQPADDCLSRNASGSQTVLRNVCNGPISVAICAAGQSDEPFLRPCGDGGPLNKFYTDSRAIGAGESLTIKAGSIKVAACNGRASATGMGGFSSEDDGTFTCPARSPRSVTAYPDTVQATSAESQDKACNLARDGFPNDQRSPAPCDCSNRRGQYVTIHACQAHGRLRQPDRMEQFIRGARDLLDELAQCDPKRDDTLCQRLHKLTNPGGVRG